MSTWKLNLGVALVFIVLCAPAMVLACYLPQGLAIAFGVPLGGGLLYALEKVCP